MYTSDDSENQLEIQKNNNIAGVSPSVTSNFEENNHLLFNWTVKIN